MLNNKTKTIGILGGTSSYETAMFFKDIISLIPSEENCDHIRIIIDNNPHISRR
jgi:aspartate racemase